LIHALGPLACSDSELTYETMNPFRHTGRTLWMGDRPSARHPPTQERRRYTSMTQAGFEPTIPVF